MTGAQIHSLAQLRDLALSKRSIISPKTWFARKPIPAAFIYQMSGELIQQLIDGGLYVYEKAATTKGKKR